MSTSLSNQEIERYSRHLILPEVGVKGQEKLRDAQFRIAELERELEVANEEWANWE